MKRKKIISLLLLVAAITILSIVFANRYTSKKINDISVSVIAIQNNKVTIQDENNITYTLKKDDINVNVGDSIIIKYTGILDKNKELQDIKVLEYTALIKETDKIPSSWQDNGIFKDYYTMAYNKLKTMSLDEKIGQLFLVRYDGNINQLKKYKFGGYVFFKNDFKGKTTKEVQDMINSLQKVSNIPLLTAVDEEGGKVVRISSNSNLAESKFKSPQELYSIDGFNTIKQDTINKSKILENLGINLNLAPVVDVSTDPNDYIYPRSLGKDTALTSEYAKTVIEASKQGNVSYTLKHFPGYGNNSDTHVGNSVDNKTIEDIKKYDLPPFEEGIKKGAEAVMVSHNIVNSIDKTYPASLSVNVHNLLRNDLSFTGVIISDNLDMQAVSTISNPNVQSILAGNDLTITTDYVSSINEVKQAVNNNTISEDLIDKLVFKVLSWKYYKGLMNNSK